VVATFANNSEAWWLGLSITFITFHFFLMAILVCAYVRRVSGGCRQGSEKCAPHLPARSKVTRGCGCGCGCDEHSSKSTLAATIHAVR
jgi:hypothetical protein